MEAESWVKDGDYSSRLFHKVAGGRMCRNFIRELELESVEIVRKRPMAKDLDWSPILRGVLG